MNNATIEKAIREAAAENGKPPLTTLVARIDELREESPNETFQFRLQDGTKRITIVRLDKVNTPLIDVDAEADA